MAILLSVLTHVLPALPALQTQEEKAALTQKLESLRAMVQQVGGALRLPEFQGWAKRAAGPGAQQGPGGTARGWSPGCLACPPVPSFPKLPLNACPPLCLCCCLLCLPSAGGV
jgi:hypothetical protein